MSMDPKCRARAEQCVRQLLYEIGEDPAREGLRETPRRVVKALEELREGNSVDIEKILSVQFEEAAFSNEIVALCDIPFSSTCEHHLLPFTGSASIAYIPSFGKVVGLSKLARLVDAYAMRLQLQEKMTGEIADAIVKHLGASGVAVYIRAAHSCMACRGVKKSGATMVTSALRGVFREDAAARAEVMGIVGS